MRPESETQLAEMVREAKEPLRIQGGGTRPVGRILEGTVLDARGLRGISLYEPGALTLVAGAGTPVSEIEAALEAHNQMLAFEPMDHRTLLGTSGTPTLGGVVAGNVSGPRRVSAVGACRDSVLGVRFVDGAGQVVKNGGRVMKNVTGYDLSKLMCGAYGTLGVLSEVALKVLPRPEAEATLTVPGLNVAQAVDAMAAALKSPFEVTGAAWDPAFGVRLRIEGLSASVAYREGRLQALMAPFGAASITDDSRASAQIWRAIRDVERLKDHAVVVRVSIKPGNLTELLHLASETLCDPRTRAPGFDIVADWGGGLVWFGAKTPQLEICAQALSAGQGAVAETGGRILLDYLKRHCAGAGGHATLIKGPVGLRRGVASFQPEAAPVAALTTGLRQRFDPRGILNSGLME